MSLLTRLELAKVGDHQFIIELGEQCARVVIAKIDDSEVGHLFTCEKVSHATATLSLCRRH